MTVYENSRYKHTEEFLDVRPNRRRVSLLGARRRFGFVQHPLNRYHIVRAGDTLHSLAAKYFPNYPFPARLWWVISDFQIPTIVDPTIQLTPGSVMIIPSEQLVAYIIDYNAGDV